MEVVGATTPEKMWRARALRATVNATRSVSASHLNIRHSAFYILQVGLEQDYDSSLEAMATIRKPDQPSAVSNNPIPSSSPAFGTPVHPVLPRKVAPIRAPPALKPGTKSTVLPILLPPATLRPLAFRTFTKKHNLTLTSSALQALSAFIGRQCGSGWREEGLAEKVLEEVAKSWKKCSSQVIVEGDGETLKGILKTLEGSMIGGRIVLSRQGSFNVAGDSSLQEVGGMIPRRPTLENQTSFGMSSLEVEDKDEEEDLLKDPREWIKVIGAFDQPKLVYNVIQKHFDKYGKHHLCYRLLC